MCFLFLFLYLSTHAWNILFMQLERQLMIHLCVFDSMNFSALNDEMFLCSDCVYAFISLFIHTTSHHSCTYVIYHSPSCTFIMDNRSEPSTVFRTCVIYLPPSDTSDTSKSHTCSHYLFNLLQSTEVAESHSPECAQQRGLRMAL